MTRQGGKAAGAMRAATGLAGAAVIALAVSVSLAQASDDRWPDKVCRADVPPLVNSEALARTRERMLSGQAVVIVAFGSSSTRGTGASMPGFTYPAQLEEILRGQVKGSVRVINRGVGGETILEMRRRLTRDVLTPNPDLVIWQVGSNAILRSMEPAAFAVMLDEELERIARSGIDVILMGPQKAPMLDSKPGVAAIIEDLRSAAERNRVALMPRHRIMESWSVSKDFPGKAIIADGIHMNDLGYHCLAVLLAEGILGRNLPAR